MQPVLEALLRERGARSLARDEVQLSVPHESEAELLDAPLSSRGRADAIYNRFVVEFEPPGSLRPSLLHSATRHAVDQVRQYLRGVQEATGLSLERLAGCAFDGSWLIYVTWERGEWKVARPSRVDRASLTTLVDILQSLATGRGLTAENLDEDFGRDSDVARLFVGELASLFAESRASERAQSMLRQWHLDLGNASGPFSATDLDEWNELCAAFGLPVEEEHSRAILFSLQTYFALVAKLVAVVILEGATGQPLVQKLTEGESIFDGFHALESGVLTASTMAANAIDPGVFSWYAIEPAPRLEEPLMRMAELANEYSAEIVEITPLVARDVLKDLFQRLLPRTIRHRLGEYYTPDWLAQRVINVVTDSTSELSPSRRVLDPACGSGTFLVEVISRMIDTARDENPTEVLAQILQNVVGFDLSPLAVQASKVNYLLALAPLIRFASDPIHLPVFLADSVSPPQRGGLLEGNVYVLESSEGDWRIPGEVAEQNALPKLGAIFHQALESNRDATWVRAQVEEELELPKEYATILSSIETLYDKLRELDEAGRNGMWWELITNAFAPAIHRDFDFVVGNPPWVSWGTLPERYRRANDEQWQFYRLRPDAPFSRRQASSNVQLDLSMLFVAHCLDKYLVGGGRLGFVITVTIFQSELAGRGFRKRHLPPRSTYSFSQIDDMRVLRVFEGAANQTAVVVAERRPPRGGPIPVTRWTGTHGHTIPTSIELEEALSLTTRTPLVAEPVAVNDPASPLLIVPEAALELSRPLRHPSFYADLIRKGIDTRGANGIFFVEILERNGDLITVRNLPREGRNRRVVASTGTVEREAVRPLLRGEDVSRDRAEPSLGVLFFHTQDHVSTPLSPAEAAARFPHATAFVTQFQQLLQSRPRFRSFNPSGDQWMGLYSVTTAALAPHKVVMREIASGMIAAAIEGGIVPDHKLYVIPCQSAGEADRLARVLNSPVVDFLARAFSVTTSITGSSLRYLAIGNLAAVPDSIGEEESLAAALGISVEEYRVLDEIARASLPTLRPPA